MPTAAKIFAAIFFFGLCYLAAEAVKPFMPPDSQTGYMSLISAVIGAPVGWYVSGDLAGRGLRAAIGTGMRSAITAVILALLFFSGREMILRSINHRYHGPTEALQAMMGLMLYYGKLVLNPPVALTLLGGGAVVGLMVEWVNRRWR